MAISHVQPLLLLLTSLFFLPALYAIKFEYCTNYAFGKVTNVTVTKDDDPTTATIYVSVSLQETGIDHDFYVGSVTVEVTTGESETAEERKFDLGDVVDDWPIMAGTDVVLILTKIPLQNYKHESYDKAIVTVECEDSIELCINFNISSTASAAVSA